MLKSDGALFLLKMFAQTWVQRAPKLSVLHFFEKFFIGFS